MVREEAARARARESLSERPARERTRGDAGREDTKRLWNVECGVAAGGRVKNGKKRPRREEGGGATRSQGGCT